MNREASNDWNRLPAVRERVLLCGVNWIGDTIMSMPAVEAWRKVNPDAHLSVLVKKSLQPLWELHAAPDRIVTYDDSSSGTFAIGKTLRDGRFGRAIILPNSFRSALIPFVGRIPERIGAPGHFRAPLLTKRIPVKVEPGREHQAYEYFPLLGMPVPETLLPPHLVVSDGARESALARMGSLPRPIIGILPGAARGPSKRWPAEHFIALARRFVLERMCGVALFGSEAEQPLCEEIHEAVGAASANLAGRTGLKDWAAALSCCDLVVCNDSGGMHLAAAVGVPVAAIFGLTDPTKTGPLGGNNVIIRSGEAGSRDIARTSEAAAKALASISPDRVFEAAEPLLAGAG